MAAKTTTPAISPADMCKAHEAAARAIYDYTSTRWADTTHLLEALAALEPTRTLSVARFDWRHVSEYGPAYTSTAYNASVHPGFNGANCQVYTADTLEALCALIVADRDRHLATLIDADKLPCSDAEAKEDRDARQAERSQRDADASRRTHEAQGGIDLYDYSDAAEAARAALIRSGDDN